jgi:hypothetical protein
MKYVKLFENFVSISTDTNTDINQIVYGNPPLEYIEIMERPDDLIKDWFDDNGETERIKLEAPLNDSETTKKDLEYLVDRIKRATPEEITFARYVDDVSNLAQTFIDLLKEKGHAEDMGSFFRIDQQTEGILHYLKDLINRPRPYQLAKTLNIPVYPLMRTDAMSAAYPSGHGLTAYVMSEYYARKYPDMANDLRLHGQRIAESRELTGIHYPSDTIISKEIAQIIIDNELLTT